MDALYFPVWWYTKGLRRVAVGCAHYIEEMNLTLAPGLWLKYMFVPMFGQRDFQGRLMSIFMRIVNIIGRSVALFVYSLSIFFLLFLWIAFPVFVVIMLTLSLSAL